MAQPRPRDEFASEGEYLKAYWIMSEFGVDVDDYDHFESFFNGVFNSKCPQTLGEKKHWDALPEVVTFYRGTTLTTQCDGTGIVGHQKKTLQSFLPAADPKKG